MRRTWLMALLLGGACTAQTGTIALGLTEAPGSTLLDGVESIHVIVTNPRQEFDTTRGTAGFDLAFDLDATAAQSGALIVNGYDATNHLIATGASPPFPIAAITARIVIYMAPPRSILPAPVGLATAISDLAVGPLNYGGVLAGGRDASGAPSTQIAIYNAFDHTLLAGLAMPAARANQALGVDQAGLVFLFGGSDATTAATGTLWRFDTTVAPNGGYTDLGDHPELARTGEHMVLTGPDEFVVTGQPVIQLAALGTTLVKRATPASLPAAGAGLTTLDGVVSAVFAERNQLVRFRNDVVDDLATAVPPDPIATALAPAAIVIAGSSDQLLRVDLAAGTITSATAIGTPRKDAAIAATERYLVIAGGTDAGGAIVPTAEVFDTTLARIAVIPLVVGRTKASALALPNGQVLIAGGVDANGAPAATIELFTPDY